MIEDALLQYGAMGAFTAYLIYDRTIILEKILRALQANTDVLRSLHIRAGTPKKGHGEPASADRQRDEVEPER